MEVMHRAVVKSRTLRALPGEMTNERINGATLPVKIETARRAIAACTDLPELLQYRDQAEGLAAAVRVMKNVGPEMIRQANELMADAWRKGGELLAAYSSARPPAVQQGKKGFKDNGGTSPRGKIAESVGLSRPEATAMVRLAVASKKAVYIAVGQTQNMRLASLKVPTFGVGGRKKYGDNLRLIMSGNRERGGGGGGLVAAATNIAQIDRAHIQQLTPDERKMVKAKITEIMELLDEMDRLCK